MINLQMGIKWQYITCDKSVQWVKKSVSQISNSELCARMFLKWRILSDQILPEVYGTTLTQTLFAHFHRVLLLSLLRIEIMIPISVV
jgi:hypothetical protein